MVVAEFVFHIPSLITRIAFRRIVSFSLARQVEQFPVLGFCQEGIEDLSEVPGGGLVLVGAVEHTGPREDLPLVSRFRSFVDSTVRSRVIRLAICCFCCSSSAIRSSADFAMTIA